MSAAAAAPFTAPLAEATPLRQAIWAAERRPETQCLPPLIMAASQTPDQQAKIATTARRLIAGLRAAPQEGATQALMREFALNTDEGVALMCLAEALLRIPDAPTRDALIRDKLGGGDWASHLGQDRPLFVNAATWGLLVTGKLSATVSEKGLVAALTRLVARLGEPVIRAGVDAAMRLLGEQFVTGQNIAEALRKTQKEFARGYRFSFDMLGEAAATAADAARYHAAYEDAIHAIGRQATGGPYAANGISIKLSALHPRFARAQADRVTAELLPRVITLAELAKRYDIGLNIDAEEADRLELSLNILEALCAAPSLQGWAGLGFVVQAYGKRAPFVLDYIIDLARRSGRRIMVRLVKGAYWDAEIKRAQTDGQAGYPVFTRKVHTDVSYLACARKLLTAREAVFPQFATHNAQTLASIFHMAGEGFTFGDYEFQCLHGMGEPLYDQVIGEAGLARPCRIYAPVGSHETLLAYLVRRLLENGANTSFVNRIADASLPVEALIADPAAEAAAIVPNGAPHPKIAEPAGIFPGRANSRGLDLASEPVLSSLAETFARGAGQQWHAGPVLATDGKNASAPRPVFNPGELSDQVGTVAEPSEAQVAAAAVAARAGFASWNATPVAARAACLMRAADAFEREMPALMGLIMREAGKTASNAVAEVREAVDFLRYYASEAGARLQGASGLGPVACISPWNFPLAIFTGQVAAALAVGNPVLAKPAEETPLIAAEASRLLHEAGIPRSALQLLPGDGRIGAALVNAPEVAGVMFTGSTEVARLINQSIARRLTPDGRPITLIAETGGINAMVVDSSALTEQVVADVLASAFDSAGQRCSALRLLCLQDDVADRTLAMLRGAALELRLGASTRLTTDVGPVITAEARANIEGHITAMQRAGHKVERFGPGQEKLNGHFVPPAIVELKEAADLQREVFGPVLHVLRFRRDGLEALIEAINAKGFGLTFGLHTRIDETIALVTGKISAGNIYVNRNIIGAVVGAQPFGGHGLSGTGPKAGGPFYLERLCLAQDPAPPTRARDLPGPVGEHNTYTLHPRGRILCLADTPAQRAAQRSACEDSGNTYVEAKDGWPSQGPFSAALVEAGASTLLPFLQELAGQPGAVVPVFAAPYPAAAFFAEVSTSVNTAAAGGNASLMMIG